MDARYWMQDAEEKKILDDQFRQEFEMELEMEVTRIRNSRAVKKSKQASKQKDTSQVTPRLNLGHFQVTPRTILG